MLTVLVIIAVLGVLFGAAALATYDGDVLRDAPPDRHSVGLPATSVQPEDVAEVRFDMALRGYRMAEVDDVLARLAAELTARDDRVRDLERALAEALEPAVVEAEQRQAVVADDELPPVEVFPTIEAPAASAPAAIAGPLTATTWWTDQPADQPTEPPTEPPTEDVASTDVMEAQAEPEQTHEPEPAGEVASVAVADADEDASPSDVPAPEPSDASPEPEELALTGGDDAFSFPELQPPDPAEDEPEAPQPTTWWNDPSSGGTTGST